MTKEQALEVLANPSQHKREVLVQAVKVLAACGLKAQQ